MIKLKFYSLIRMYLGINEITLDSDPVSIYELLQQAEKQIGKTFIDQLLDNKQKILPGTMILINGRNIVHLNGINSQVEDNDEVSIFPPGGGG